MPEREHHFRGRKDKDVQRRMITPLLAGARKGFLEKMLYEHGQRRGGDGTTHKRHGTSKSQKTGSARPVWETAGSMVWLECSTCVPLTGWLATRPAPYEMNIRGQLSSLRASLVCSLFPSPTFSASTRWHTLRFVRPLFLFWHRVFHLKGPDL